MHAFDIQAAALEETRVRVAADVPSSRAPALHCHLQSHADMLQHVAPGTARLVVFNLGALD